nr:hypothetical protein [Evansella halocellulosilytica]
MESTKGQSGMWANSTFKDLVHYNDGFKTGLIGTAEQLADRIIELKKMVLTSFWLVTCITRVIPLVKEKNLQ